MKDNVQLTFFTWRELPTEQVIRGEVSCHCQSLGSVREYFPATSLSCTLSYPFIPWYRHVRWPADDRAILPGLPPSCHHWIATLEICWSWIKLRTGRDFCRDRTGRCRKSRYPTGWLGFQVFSVVLANPSASLALHST